MIDASDRRLIVATQAGLPLVPRPYHALAEQLGLTAAEVQQRLACMLDSGVIRRIGAVPNHYAIGYTANGMTVWDVDDAIVDKLGVRVGALDFVTHCYRRPRRLPQWRYNLFAMVHAASRDEVEVRAADIAALLGETCRAGDILYSSRILKKTGLRLATDRNLEPHRGEHPSPPHGRGAGGGGV
jgi:DNA-binding Lrp family transcriptional regulator